MNWARVSAARLIALFHKEQIEDAIDAELRFHLDMRIRENIARGMSPSEAANAAALRFGNFNCIKDACRDVRGGGILEDLLNDLKFAFRIFRKDRAFATMAVLALALSIGANTVIFSVVNRVLVRALPYGEPNQLVAIWSGDSHDPNSRFSVSYPDFEDLRNQSHSFERSGAFYSTTFIVSGLGPNPSRLPGARVTPDVFPMLHVQPLLGRFFTAAENRPGSRVAIISYDLWKRKFDSSAKIIGTPIVLDEQVYRIIGVMRARFQFPIQNEVAQIWTTTGPDFESQTTGEAPTPTLRGTHYMQFLGRLKSTTTAPQAQVELSNLATNLAKKYPNTNSGFDACIVAPLLQDITKRARPVLLALIAAALCVLTIACVNVANLLLARGTKRQREIAIRSALGAGRRRILTQLLTESLLLAAAGCVGGLLIYLGGTICIVSILPSDFPRALEIVPDFNALLFAASITLLSTCLIGIAPALRSTRVDVVPLLHDSSRICTETSVGRRIRGALVITEMMLAFFLLVSAFFLIRDLWHLKRVYPGFESDNLFTASASLPDSPDAASTIPRFYCSVLQRLNNLSGNRAAAITPLPLSGVKFVIEFTLADGGDRTLTPRAQLYVVSPNYFSTMQIPIQFGRDFHDGDQKETQRVAIINDMLAQQYFPNENPIGKTFAATMSTDSVTKRTIVGVVGSVKDDGPAKKSNPEIYLPLSQAAYSEMTLVMRTQLKQKILFSEVQNIVRAISPNASLYNPRLMKQYLDAAVAQPRLSAEIMSTFSIIAIVLTAIGVYGVMAYSVAQREQEIGIRIALGAQKDAILRLAMKQGFQLLALAIALSTVGIFLSGRLFHISFHQDSAANALIVISAVVFLSVVALLASWLPAYRATKIDPLVALGQR
jgi:putative ABC transport system permease protein